MLKMTAPPSLQSAGLVGLHTALVLPQRYRRSRETSDAAARGKIVVRSRGRRRGGSADLLKELLDADVGTAIVSSLAVLNQSPAIALSLVGALRSAGIEVHSLAEPWLTSAETKTVCAIAAFLTSLDARRASKLGSRAVARGARASGGRVGRPAKPMTVSPHEALQIVERLGWRKAGQHIGTSPASIRRHLARAGLLPITPVQRSA